jgi:transcriptional regulator with XRE-family HTH domain
MEKERRLRGWSQMTLGFYAGLVQGDISKIERRRKMPSPARAKKIAHALGVPASALLDEVPEPDAFTADTLPSATAADAK